MTTEDENSTDEPFDSEDFADELMELISHAEKADIDVRGSYDVRTPRPDQNSYTVEISEIA